MIAPTGASQPSPTRWSEERIGFFGSAIPNTPAAITPIRPKRIR